MNQAKNHPLKLTLLCTAYLISFRRLVAAKWDVKIRINVELLSADIPPFALRIQSSKFLFTKVPEIFEADFFEQLKSNFEFLPQKGLTSLLSFKDLRVKSR
jgi:hypothetical protein